MKIDNKLNLGDIVYVKTDPEQLIRMITGILVNFNGLEYRVSIAEEMEFFYYEELSYDTSIEFM